MRCKKVVNFAGKGSAEGWSMYALIEGPELNLRSVATAIPRRDGCFTSRNVVHKIEFVCACYSVVGAPVKGCPLGN
jgi:hypothetical protein